MCADAAVKLLTGALAIADQLAGTRRKMVPGKQSELYERGLNNYQYYTPGAESCELPGLISCYRHSRRSGVKLTSGRSLG